MKKTYFVDGTFSGAVDAESEEEARMLFDEMCIDDISIVSVEQAETEFEYE